MCPSDELQDEFGDEYAEVHMRCLFLNEVLKDVRIVCRCDYAFIVAIPRDVCKGGAVPIIHCPECHQEYVLYNGKMVRMDDFATVNGELIPPGLMSGKTWKKKTRTKEN